MPNLRFRRLDLISGVKLWTPSVIGSTLLSGWYDASDAATVIHSSNAVSQWNDKSGNNRHLTQGTGANQPTTNTRTLNGLNVLDFDGVNDSISRSAFPVDASGDLAVFMVATIDAISSINDSIWAMDAATADYQFQADHTTQFNGQINQSGLGANLILTGGPFPGPSIYNTNFDFNDLVKYNAYVDGTKRGADTTYTTKVGASQLFRIFLNRGNNQWIDGACAETIVTTDVTTATRQKIEGYLAWKWGLVNNLPSTHIYKRNPPKL